MDKLITSDVLDCFYNELEKQAFFKQMAHTARRGGGRAFKAIKDIFSKAKNPFITPRPPAVRGNLPVPYDPQMASFQMRSRPTTGAIDATWSKVSPWRERFKDLGKASLGAAGLVGVSVIGGASGTPSQYTRPTYYG